MAIVLTTDDTRREVFLKAEQAKIHTESILPELDNPASTGDVLKDKEYIDGNGDKKTGTLVVCDTVQADGYFGNSGYGVSVNLVSVLDGSTKILTLPETNLLPDNIKSGVDIFGILGTLSLGLFDDEIDCEIGTFELAEDKNNGYVVSLKRTDSEPYMIAFWTDDPKFTDDSGNYLYYRIGGLFIKSSLENAYSCAAIFAANGFLAAQAGKPGGAFRVYPKSGGIYIGSSSTYPLKAGIRYKWIARWLS